MKWLRLAGSIFFGTLAWMMLDVVHAAPPHELFHFWDQYSLAGIGAFTFAILSYICAPDDLLRSR